MKCEAQSDQDALTDIVLYALMGVSAGAARGMPDASGMQTTLLSILRDLLMESGTPPPPSLDRLLARTRRNQQRRARRRQRDALRQQQQAGGAAGGAGGAQPHPGDARRMRAPAHAPAGGPPMPPLSQQLPMPGLPMPPFGAGPPHQLPPGALPHPLQSQLRNSNVEGNQLAQMLAQRNLASMPPLLPQQQGAAPVAGSSQEGRRRPRQPRPPRDPWCPTDPHYRQEGDNEE